MVKKSNEKIQNRNTKEEILNLDNEIIIGIKKLPEQNSPKNKKLNSNKKVNKKKNAKVKHKNEKINSNNARTKNTKINNKKVKNKKQKVVMTPKEQEIAKQKRKVVFRIIKCTTLATILIGGGIFFLLSPFFNVKEITTSGQEKITKEEIISLSQLQIEENTFKMELKEAEKKIKENAYIETVNIKRKLPDKIEIEIVERKPQFMLTFANAYVYINSQGYILEVTKDAIAVPIITGFATKEEEIQVGNRLCTEDLQKLENALQIMKSAKSNELDSLITKINIEDKQDYILELKQEKKTIHIGDNSNLSTKMLYIISILEENKDVEGEIFVNTDLNNKGAIFRKKI